MIILIFFSQPLNGNDAHNLTLANENISVHDFVNVDTLLSSTTNQLTGLKMGSVLAPGGVPGEQELD